MSRAILVLLLVLFPTTLSADDRTVAGEVELPHPTLVHLSIVWRIEGDDDGDGVVTVRFRAAGERRWRGAMDLRRVPAGRSRGTTPVYSWPNQHSGSLFGLVPDTEYEIELSLVDPDGGRERRLVRGRTRPVPRVPAGLPSVAVTPATLAAAVEPGRVLVLAPGDYGEVTIEVDGQPGRPVVLRAAEPGTAVFGRVNLWERRFVHLDGLVVRGSIDLRGASDCSIRYCTVEVDGGEFGIGARSKAGATRCYIADNVVTGTNEWLPEAMGAEGENFGEGIELTGPGNVICFNRVVGFRDLISFMEDGIATEQVSIDVYGNDLSVGVDDAIEADFAMGNCRIVGNRITNCFVGLSSQPSLGGPTYFLRNVLYNITHSSFKLHRYSQGDVCLHNTVVKIGDGMSCFTWEEFDHAFFRNNLTIGGPAGEATFGGYEPGPGMAATMARPGAHCSFDHDALGAHGLPLAGRFGDQRFEDLAALRRGPHEKNAIEVGMDVFDGVAFPGRPVPVLDPPDLRPRRRAVVVDRALALPNINDRFIGRGPDIGALEAGAPLPHYGPRPRGVDESTDD